MKKKSKEINEQTYDFICFTTLAYEFDFSDRKYQEINLQSKSKYFNKSKSNFADLEDFNLKKMTMDYLDKYNKITELDMKGILNFAIYLYHMR